jgi:pectate lyase
MNTTLLNRMSLPMVIAFCIALVSLNASGQPPAAFPGAQGGGAAAKGGRGGAVIMVTSLANAGAGTLRACIEASGPRTCVFRVGGTINLTSTLRIPNPFLTIAGQTAPGGGILLRGTSMGANIMVLNNTDMIIRYIRFRKGSHPGCADGAATDCGANLVMGARSGTTMIDHISSSWNQDEGAALIANSTLSYSLMTQPLATHPTLLLSAGGSESASANIVNADFHHNLVMNSGHRNPLLRNKSSRVVNNILYNHRLYSTHVSGGVTTDIIGNLYRRGPLRPNAAWHEIGGFTGHAGLSAPGVPSLFISGNIGWHQPDPSADQTPLTTALRGENGPDSGPMPGSWRRSTPLPDTEFPITPEPVGNIEDSILPTVGASQRLDCDGNWVPNRDSVDIEQVNQYRNNTGIRSLQATEAGYGGFPTIAAGTPCEDSDLDGMPDAWETARGLSNSSDSDRNGDLDNDGYTNLEEYLAGPPGL